MQRCLDPPLTPTAHTMAARRGTYRIRYLLDDDRRIVEVTAVRHRFDAYRT